LYYDNGQDSTSDVFLQSTHSFSSKPAKGIGKGKGKVYYASERKMRQSLSSKAGVVFPVGRIHRLLKQGRYANRVSTGAAGTLPIHLRCYEPFAHAKPVYLAAVLEYLVAELTELAGNCALDNRKVRIIPRHLLIAIKNDAE
jgi:histone H2A